MISYQQGCTWCCSKVNRTFAPPKWNNVIGLAVHDFCNVIYVADFGIYLFLLCNRTINIYFLTSLNLYSQK
jgi:hypothetical protein